MWNGDNLNHASEPSWFEGKREALADLLSSKAQGLTSTMTEQIKAHPIAAVGIAFAAGYIVTRLVRR